MTGIAIVLLFGSAFVAAAWITLRQHAAAAGCIASTALSGSVSTLLPFRRNSAGLRSRAVRLRCRYGRRFAQPHDPAIAAHAERDGRQIGDRRARASVGQGADTSAATKTTSSATASKRIRCRIRTDRCESGDAGYHQHRDERGPQRDHYRRAKQRLSCPQPEIDRQHRQQRARGCGNAGQEASGFMRLMLLIDIGVEPREPQRAEQRESKAIIQPNGPAR